MSTAPRWSSMSPSGRIATALACRKTMPMRSYTGCSGKTTSSLSSFPTPTQMLEGIQFHRELGETTVTVCFLPRPRRPRSRDRWSAAVCPEIPAPRITTSATEGSLHGENSCLAYPWGYIQGLTVLTSPTSKRGIGRAMAADDIPQVGRCRWSPYEDDADMVHPPNRHAHGRAGSPTGCGPMLQHHWRDAAPTATHVTGPGLI